jgi:hypothetical protein
MAETPTTSLGIGQRGLTDLQNQMGAAAAEISRQMGTLNTRMLSTGLASWHKASFKGLNEYKRQMDSLSAEMSRARTIDEAKSLAMKIRNLDTAHRAEMSKMDALADRQEEIIADLAKKQKRLMSEAFTESVEALESSLSTLQSRNWEGMGKGMFKGVGSMLQRKGEGMAAKGVGTGNEGVANMGKIVATLGRAAMAMTAVVGIAALVVKTLVDADAQAKEFNKSLIAGGAGADMVVAGTKNIKEGMDLVRKAVVDNMSLWHDFRASNKEVLDTLAALNAAGMTYRKIAQGARDASEAQQRFVDAAGIAIQSARLFGMTEADMGKQVGSMYENLGMDLKAIDESFQDIFKVAQTAGFGVKRFYEMIQQATDNMEGYNSSMADNAKLLSVLSKALNPRQASAFFQTLTQGYKSSSMTDMIKETVLMGPKNAKKLVELNAQSQSETFLKNMGDQSKDVLDIVGATDSKDLIKKLRAMSPEERAKVTAQVKGQVGVDKGRAFDDLSSTALGTGRGIPGTAMALSQLGPGATMVAKMLRTKAAFGMTAGELDDPSMALTAAAAESGMNLSGKERREMGSITRDLKAKWLESGEKGKDGKRGGLDFTEFLMKNSQSFEDVLKDPVTKQTEALQNQEQYLKDSLRVAQDTSASTIEMSGIMDKGVAYFLEKVSGTLENIWDVVSGYLGDGRKLTQEEQTAKSKKREELEAERKDLVEKEKSLKASLKGASPAQADQIQFALGQMPQQYAHLKARMQGLDRIRGSDDNKGSLTFDDASILQARSTEEKMRDMPPEQLAKLREQAQMEGANEAGRVSRALQIENPNLSAKDVESSAQESGKKRESEYLAKLIADSTLESDRMGAVIIKTTLEKIEKERQEAENRNTLAAVSGMLGYSPAGMVSAEEYDSLITKLDPGKLAQAGITRKVNDFVYRNDGTITPIDSADQLFNLPSGDIMGAKPGGAVSQAGGRSVNITMNLTGTNEQEIYRGVRRALKEIDRL